ncbi:MAG: CDP-diacylglycerol--serine O-phosphatidyltransferase, partial [Desulfatiglandales bacterium]
MKRRYFKRQKRRKGIYILPNLITSASLYFGFSSILVSFSGRLTKAAIYILISAILDALDGRIARLTNSTSRFGVEYDSLSDLVAFGAAPAILLYFWALEGLGRLGMVSAFIFLICGALRLARFNTQTSSSNKEYFTGLPIPGAAGIVASGVIFLRHFELTFDGLSILGVIFANLLGFLMVSTLRYPSFKGLNLTGARPFHVLVTSIVLLLPVLYYPQVMLFALFCLYVFGGPLYGILRPHGLG